MIVGICGDIGSGKDVVASHLVYRHGFKTLSFAEKLKSWVFDLVKPLGVKRRHIYGASAETKQADQAEPLDMLPHRNPESNTTGGFRSVPKEYWTGRSLLEHLGTDVGREIDPNVWVKHLIATVRRHRSLARQGEEPRFVVSDVRFPNEFDAIRELGGKIWRTRLLVSHGMDLRPGRDPVVAPCPAADSWREACHCGAIESTSHLSDEAWRFEEFDRLLAAPKPGIVRLREIADAHMKEIT